MSSSTIGPVILGELFAPNTVSSSTIGPVILGELFVPKYGLQFYVWTVHHTKVIYQS